MLSPVAQGLRIVEDFSTSVDGIIRGVWIRGIQLEENLLFRLGIRALEAR